MRRRSFLIAQGVAACGVFATGQAAAQRSRISGAGASFPRAVYERWGQQAAEAAGIELSYEAAGSVAGVDRVTSRSVDFGASDAPRSANRLREGALLQFPTLFGAVVPSVNLPGVADGQLRLPADALADIYLGKIKRWNDAKLAEHNRDLRLPDLPIVPVHRSEGSGTTFIFTTYLSRVSDAWQGGPRAGTTVTWPAGQGARGSDGVATLVAQTPGAIGYVEKSSAIRHNMVTAQLRNKAGRFVKPEVAAFAAAAATADLAAPNFAFDVVDADPAEAWPIVSPTFVLVPTNPAADKVEPTRNALRFFDWAFEKGGEAASGLGFVPLPQAVAQKVREAWKGVKAPDGAVLWPAI